MPPTTRPGFGAAQAAAPAWAVAPPSSAATPPEPPFLAPALLQRAMPRGWLPFPRPPSGARQPGQSLPRARAAGEKRASPLVPPGNVCRSVPDAALRHGDRGVGIALRREALHDETLAASEPLRSGQPCGARRLASCRTVGRDC